MNNNIGIIACPGTDQFTKALISNINFLTNINQNNLIINTEFIRFANGEIKTIINDNIINKDIYIVQDLYSQNTIEYSGNNIDNYSVNDKLITLITTIDAVRNCNVQSINCILPAYPYSRQHKNLNNEGTTAMTIGSILESMSVNRILTLDIHSQDIVSSLKNIKIINLTANDLFIQTLLQIPNINHENITIVCPDKGSISRNQYFANRLKCPLMIFSKQKDYKRISFDCNNSNIECINLETNMVMNNTAIIIDDILDTGSTILKTIKYLKNNGIKKIIVCVSLPMFSCNAIKYFNEYFNQKYFDYIIGTTAINQSNKLINQPWYINTDISLIFANRIVYL